MPSSVSALVLLLLALSADAAAGGPAPSLFTELPAGEVAAASAIDVATAFPGVDVVKLAGSDAPALKTTGINRVILASQPPRLQLDLPNVAKPVTARVRRDLSQVPARARGFAGSEMATAASTAVGDVWVGEVSGAPGPLSTVVLVTSDSGAVWADIRWYDKKTRTIRSFKVVPETDRSQVDAAVQAANAAATADLYPQLNPNKYIVVEYREPRGERKYLLPPAQATDTGAITAAAAAEAADVSAPTLVPEATRSEATPSGSDGAGGGNNRKLLQSTVAQDLLIVYTAAAAARIGGVEAMKVKAWQNVIRTNKAYADSGINVQLSLVGIRQTNWTEPVNITSALSDLQAGKVTGVHGWRDELGADLVSLFDDFDGAVTGGRICGWGYVAGGSNQAQWGFSEILRGCADGFAFAHETGHNQGCGHLYGDGSSARTTYAFGWRRCDLGAKSWKSIMADWCYPGIEAGMFSNPDKSFNGAPAGDAAAGDCARNIRETASAVAAYRATRVAPLPAPPSPPPAPPSPPPSPPPPRPPSNGRPITYQNQNVGKCVVTPNYNDGARVQIWECCSSSPCWWEQWNDGSVAAVGTTKCLSVSSSFPANGAAVVIGECLGSNSQRWFID